MIGQTLEIFMIVLMLKRLFSADRMQATLLASSSTVHVTLTTCNIHYFDFVVFIQLIQNGGCKIYKTVRSNNKWGLH